MKYPISTSFLVFCFTHKIPIHFIATKKICYYLLFSLVLVSCNKHYTNNKTMLAAESLLEIKPDSAQKLLLSIPRPKQLPQADYAAWCLLYTNSQYKLYQDIKSDSLIWIAVNYYNSSNLSKQSGTAYYLWGCILQQNKKFKEAMVAYKKAEKALKTTKEFNLKSLVEFEIGYLYKEDEAYEQSLIFFRKSLNGFTISMNKKYQAYAYREISDRYSQLNYPFDSIMHYSNKALKQANMAGDSINYYSIIARQGELFIYTNHTRSKEYLLKAYQHCALYRSHYAALLSYDYAMLNQTDSAQYYMRLSLSDTQDTKYSVTKYLAMAYIAKNNGKYDKAFNHLETAYLLRDSTLRQSIESQLHRIDKQYDLTQKEKENTNLKIDNQYMIIYISLLIIVILILSVSALLIRNRHRRKQSEHAIKEQHLRYKIENKQKENNQKRELLQAKLQNRIENTLRFNHLKVGLLQQDKLDGFIEEIIRQTVISENEWQYYIDEINQLYDGKIVTLSESHKSLTPADLIVTALICLRKDITDCCSLLGMSLNAMYVRRKRLKKRLELATEIDLDKWIMDNIAQYDEEKV